MYNTVQAPDMTPMKLYFVSLRLRVKLGGHGRKARSQSTCMKLVVYADSEVSARTRVESWFERESSLPTARVMFGIGMRDALNVILDPRYGSNAVNVFEGDSDVMVVS